MPRWRSCTCAWVQASVAARSKAVGVAMLVDEVKQRARERMRPRSKRQCAHSRLARSARAGAARKSASSTVPTVSESGQAVDHRDRRSYARARGRGTGRYRSRSRVLPTALAFDDSEMCGPDFGLARRRGVAASPEWRRLRPGIRFRRRAWKKPDARRRQPGGASTSSA